VKVLVCGGRSFERYKLLNDTLQAIHAERPITSIIQGGARGADTLAREWAEGRGIPHKTYMANWALYGPKAGLIRNVEMLAHSDPDLVVAFPGGDGTSHMVKIATRGRYVVRRIGW
jgi:hypothetical protein